ncbi:hypothetical protein, partial [Sporosarcina newyorkensis]|uniref:hypothetical protein n=1 Tax=Sporosarcina newyorkensis TaxID=759851 RepID=UPI001C0A7E08
KEPFSSRCSARFKGAYAFLSKRLFEALFNYLDSYSQIVFCPYDSKKHHIQMQLINHSRKLDGMRRNLFSLINNRDS